MAIARECMVTGTGRGLIVSHHDGKWGEREREGERGREGESEVGPGHKPSKPFL